MSARPAHVPLVSVIIPTYNCAKFLPQAIESVLDQTFRDFEIVVVDDGSTDETPSIIRPFKDSIHYVQQENKGNAAARNRGVAESRGQWLCLLDADDLWEPRKLELQLIDILAHPDCLVSFTEADKFFESGEFEDFPPDPTVADLWENLVLCQPFGSSHSGLLLHRSCFEEVGNFDEELRLSVDWDIVIRLADRFKIRSLPKVLVHHRQHSSNTTGNAYLRLSMYLACLKKHRRLFCVKRNLRKQWHRSYGARLFRFGRYLLKQRRYHESMRLLVAALRFGGAYQRSDKLRLLIECQLRSVGLGRLLDWA